MNKLVSPLYFLLHFLTALEDKAQPRFAESIITLSCLYVNQGCALCVRLFIALRGGNNSFLFTTVLNEWFRINSGLIKNTIYRLELKLHVCSEIMKHALISSKDWTIIVKGLIQGSGLIKSCLVGICNAFQDHLDQFSKHQDFAPKRLCAKRFKN